MPLVFYVLVCVGVMGEGGRELCCLNLPFIQFNDEFENNYIVVVFVYVYMQGVTRIFLTKIPFFREVIVSSFTCEACGMQNAELQPASRIQDKGCIHTVSIQTPQVQLQSMAQVCQSSQVQSMTQISQSSHVQSMTQISQSSQV